MDDQKIFDMSLPSWVERTQLENALKIYLKDDTAKITNLKSKNAVPIGDNYTSDLFRTTIEYTTAKCRDIECLSVIIKCAGDGGGAKTLFATELKLFEKETNMFGKILPQLHNITGQSSLSAECLLTELEPKGLLVLQDLSPLGYKMADRRKGLDMDHCFLIMEKMAQLHASSVLLYEKNPHCMDGYNIGLFTNQNNQPIIQQFVVSGFQSTIIALKQWSGFEKYAKKLEAMMDTIFEKSMNICKREPGKFNVLNHGDLWTNNILFLYDDNDRPIDLKFVDFQFSVFSTPAIDLNYFLCTSTQDIGRKHISRLIGYYHEKLVENLNKFGYPKDKIPTYDEIYDEYKKKNFYSLITTATALPLVLAPYNRDDASYDEFSSDNKNGFRQICYSNSQFRKRCEIIFQIYNELDLFNEK